MSLPFPSVVPPPEAEVEASKRLLLFAHNPTSDSVEEEEEAKQRIYGTAHVANPFVNYFFRCPQKPYVGLCVVDDLSVGDLYAQIVSDMRCEVYFGHNSDPVEVVPLAEVITLLAAA